MEATVLFLVSNEQEISNMQGNTTDSAQGTYLELHTWYPYENSERCHPTEGTVPVKVFKAQNFSDIKKSDIFQRNYNKNFHKCRLEYMYIQNPLLLIHLNAFGVKTLDIRMYTRVGGKFNC